MNQNRHTRLLHALFLFAALSFWLCPAWTLAAEPDRNAGDRPGRRAELRAEKPENKPKPEQQDSQKAQGGQDSKPAEVPDNSSFLQTFTSALGGSSKAETSVRTPGEKLVMLAELHKDAANLQEEIIRIKTEIARNPQTEGATALSLNLENLGKRLDESGRDFERIATGVELSLFHPTAAPTKFNWKEELAALFEPMVKEMRALTATTRQKADLREQIELLERQAKSAGEAVDNLTALRQISKDKTMNRQLDSLLDTWKTEYSRLNSKLEVARMDFHALSSGVGDKGRLHNFFETRGIFLLLSLLIFVFTFALARLFFLLLARRLPTAPNGQPSLAGRFLFVFAPFLSFILALIALLAMFVIVADGFMISLLVLFGLGLLWALRQTMPHQWQRSLMLLNMGPVREGERVVLDGLPWRVDNIGLYCRLSNPALEQVRRMPIERIFDHVSRPYDLEEPWFPCKKGDYLKLAGDSVVQVISLSVEQVCVVRVGTGMTTTYPTLAFLGMAATNLSQRFMVNTTLGLSYSLQADIVRQIPDTLRAWLQQKLDDEGYAASCLAVNCSFSKIAPSSLDLFVSLEFDGGLAPLYYRLHRALEGWCVDCCTENNWEIPFNQLVVRSADPEQRPLLILDKQP